MTTRTTTGSSPTMTRTTRRTARAALVLTALAVTLATVFAWAAPAEATPKSRHYTVTNSGVTYKIWTFHDAGTKADNVIVEAHWRNQPDVYHNVGIEMRFRDQRKPRTAKPACAFRNIGNPDKRHDLMIYHTCLDRHGLIDYVDVTIQDHEVLVTKRVKVTN